MKPFAIRWLRREVDVRTQAKSEPMEWAQHARNTRGRDWLPHGTVMLAEDTGLHPARSA